MAPWVAVVEAWLVQRLLRSPSFHRAVGKVHKNVHRLRHGPLEEDLGGTNIEKQGPGFVNHFWDEIRTQAGRPRPSQNPLEHHQQPPPTQQSTRPSANQPAQPSAQQPKRNEPPPDSQSSNGGFISHFLDEIRSQTRRGDKNR